jgi:hypothetical protein
MCIEEIIREMDLARILDNIEDAVLVMIIRV